MSGFVAQNWGNLASVAGLAISVWVLAVAMTAKKAADEARSAARLKNLVEVLEEVSSKLEEIGIFLRNQKWDVVHLYSQQVLDRCKLVMSRWSDYLPETERNDLRIATTIAKSIAILAAESSMRQLEVEEQRQAFRAQIDAGEIINGVLGRARKSEEGSGG